jgi:DNA-binding CsgD family transcriptional regulator
MANEHHAFAWRLIQFPGLYFNTNAQAEAALVMVTDLSHLPQVYQPMMTMINNADRENQYFAISVENKLLLPILLPKITPKEQQLIKLIAKGLNNPLIANELNISINTVQNHKRHLREKTNTKTSAELIAFFMKHNML